jgi:hypothetical protein
MNTDATDGKAKAKGKVKAKKVVAPVVRAEPVAAVAVKPRHLRREHRLGVKARGGRRLGTRRKGAAVAGVESTAKLADLHFHPLLESTPTMSSVIEELRKVIKTARGSTLMDARERLAEREPEWRAFVGDVARRKVQESIVVVPCPTGGWWVVDGRNRTCAAREAGLETAPIRITTEAPADVILGSLAARRHVSKELLAYVALECHPYLIGEGDEGRPKKGETGNDFRFSTRAELAESIGVSDKTLQTAATIHRHFIAHPKLRAKWEWRLYAGTSFKGVLAGDAAEKAAGPGENGKPVHAASLRVRKLFQSFAAKVAKDWAAVEAEGEGVLAEVQLDFQAALSELPDAAFEWVIELAETNRRAEVKAAVAKLKTGV